MDYPETKSAIGPSSSTPDATTIASTEPHLSRSADESASPVVPQRIGPYRILGVLGEGGMGVVYRAEQEKPRRTVALKVIRPGAESRQVLQRFEHESQVLGWLHHPGIAQIYQAGAADAGRGLQPFFAMEFVEGRPLVEYANQHRIGIRHRLELVTAVCDAVHHAHQKGVIHRDLKPGNILVEESGQPKVLDFGVARVIETGAGHQTMETVAGQLIGTIAYMSPEQIEGDPRDLDTRSDVYSLGVILYELLAGQVPLDVSHKTLPQAARVIVEQEPPSLRSVNKSLGGDLETVVFKALEKDRNRRYQSASELAADIRRYLADQPITARPATALYQLRKFAKRNKALVAGAVIAVISLTWGLIQVTWERNRAIEAEQLAEQRMQRIEAESEKVARERNRAVAAEHLAEQRMERIQAESDKVKAINRFFNDMLASADPGNDGRDVRVVDVLDQAAKNLAKRLADQPEIEASLDNTIGMTYIGLGLSADAEPHLRAALKIRQTLFGDRHPETLETMTNLAGALRELGQLSEAESLIRHSLDTRTQDLGADHPLTLQAMNALGDVLQRRGRVGEAEELWSRTLQKQRLVLDRDDPQLPITMNNLAQLLKQLGRPREAEPILREAMQLQSETLVEEHPHALATMANLSGTLKALGQYDEAETLIRRVIEIRKRTLGDHPSVFQSLNNLSVMLRDEGRLAEAEPVAREAWEGLARTLGATNRSTLVSMSNLASLWVKLGRADEAEKLFLDLLDTAETALPSDHWMMLAFRGNYGECLAVLGRFEEGESLLLESYGGLEKSLGPRHENTRKILNKIIDLYEAWGKPQEAAEWRRKLPPDPDPDSQP